MAKKILTAFLCLSIFFSLAACQKNEQGAQNSSANLEGNWSTHHIQKKLGDNITVDADVIIPEGLKETGVKEIDAQPLFLDGTQKPEVLFKDKKVIKKEEYDPEPGSTHKAIDYQFSDGTGVQIGQGDLYIYSEFYDAISPVFNTNRIDPNMNMELFHTNKQFSFATVEQAKKTIHSTLKELGIEVDDKYDVYSLDYQTMQKEEKKLLNKVDVKGKQYQPKGSWSEADNCYYFSFRQKIGNIPFSGVTDDQLYSGTQSYGSEIAVVVSKKGIQYLSASPMWQATQDKDVTQDIKPVETALETIKQKYENIILKDPVKVVKAEFCYLPVVKKQGQATLTPVWQVTVAQTEDASKDGSGKKEVVTTQVFINAITGKEIL